MKHYALIGLSLKHSFSKKYFEHKFKENRIDASYELIELQQLHGLRTMISKEHLNGLNVTIPFKEKILNFLDDIDEIAAEIGAVNCVLVSNNKLIGYNTDHIGFEKSLQHFINAQHNKALVFGSGGASKAICYSLQKLKIEYLVVSRNECKNSITYIDLSQKIFDEYTLLINTTPVGTFPDIEDTLPIPFHFINETHAAFDLIYHPEKSTFLRYCEAEGASIKNGYEMLCIQADESYKLFSSVQ